MFKDKLIKDASSIDFYQSIDDSYLENIPQLRKLIGFNQNNPYHIHTVYDHTIEAIKACNSNDYVTNIALLFHDIGKPDCYTEENGVGHFYGHAAISAGYANDILSNLDFNPSDICDITQLVFYHDITISQKHKNINKWISKLGNDNFNRLIRIKEADIKAQNPEYSNRLEELKNIEKIIDNVDDNFSNIDIKEYLNIMVKKT